MSYRDDLDATRARADALERDLARARTRIDELEGRSTALVPVGATDLDTRAGRDGALVAGDAGPPAARTWLGAPTRLVFEAVLDSELPENAYTDVIETIRDRLNEVGATTTLPGSLAWTAGASPKGIGPFVNVYVSIRNGKTTIKVEEKLGNLAGGIFGGVGGGVGGGAIAAPIAVALITPWLLPVAIGAWLGGTWWGCRALYRNRVRKRAARLRGLLDAIVEVGERHIAEARAAAEGDQ